MVYCWFTLCFYLQKNVNKEQTHCWFPVMRVDAGLRALRIISLQESSLAKQKTGWVEVSCMGVDGLSTWQMRVEQISKTFWAFEKVVKGWSIKIFRYVRSLCIRKSSTTTWQVQLPTKQHLNSRRTQEWRKSSEPKRSQCRSLMSHWWHASLLGAARDSADDGLASCFGFLISTYPNSF